MIVRHLCEFLEVVIEVIEEVAFISYGFLFERGYQRVTRMIDTAISSTAPVIDRNGAIFRRRRLHEKVIGRLLRPA